MRSKPWPVTMIVSTIINWLVVAGLATLGVYILCLWRPVASTVLLYGPLMVTIGYLLVIAAVVFAASSAALLSRVVWTRVVHTAVSAVWIMAAIGIMMEAYNWPQTFLTLGVAASAVLIWLPVSRPYFTRTQPGNQPATRR